MLTKLARFVETEAQSDHTKMSDSSRELQHRTNYDKDNLGGLIVSKRIFEQVIFGSYIHLLFLKHGKVEIRDSAPIPLILINLYTTTTNT